MRNFDLFPEKLLLETKNTVRTCRSSYSTKRMYNEYAWKVHGLSSEAAPVALAWSWALLCFSFRGRARSSEVEQFQSSFGTATSGGDKKGSSRPDTKSCHMIKNPAGSRPSVIYLSNLSLKIGVAVRSYQLRHYLLQLILSKTWPVQLRCIALHDPALPCATIVCLCTLLRAPD